MPHRAHTRPPGHSLPLGVSTWSLLILGVLLLLPGSELRAATFRVTTRIFEGSKLDAAAEHIILFQQGLVYDFPQIEPRYVTVYDPAQNQVTLLDRETQAQTTLSTEDLVTVTAQARAAARTPEQEESQRDGATGGHDESGQPGTPEQVPRPNPRDPALFVERESLKCALQVPDLIGEWFDSVQPECFRHPRYAQVLTALTAAGGPGAGRALTSGWTSSLPRAPTTQCGTWCAN